MASQGFSAAEISIRAGVEAANELLGQSSDYGSGRGWCGKCSAGCSRCQWTSFDKTVCPPPPPPPPPSQQPQQQQQQLYHHQQQQQQYQPRTSVDPVKMMSSSMRAPPCDPQPMNDQHFGCGGRVQQQQQQQPLANDLWALQHATNANLAWLQEIHRTVHRLHERIENLHSVVAGCPKKEELREAVGQALDTHKWPRFRCCCLFCSEDQDQEDASKTSRNARKKAR